eukprot:gene19540-26221_t
MIVLIQDRIAEINARVAAISELQSKAKAQNDAHQTCQESFTTLSKLMGGTEQMDTINALKTMSKHVFDTNMQAANNEADLRLLHGEVKEVFVAISALYDCVNMALGKSLKSEVMLWP